MRRSVTKLYGVLFILWMYTVFKCEQLLPNHVIANGIAVAAYFGVMISWMFIYHSYPLLVESRLFRLYVWLGSLAMGLWSTYILVSLPIDLFFLISYGISSTTSWGFDSDKLHSGWLQINQIIAYSAVLFSLLGIIEVWRGPRVKKVLIPVPSLLTPLEHLKIAQISDLHVGPTIRKDYVEKVVARTNATQPDLIFVTGDLNDAKVSSILADLAPLKALKSRYGIYYVTGNHEYYWNAKELIAVITELGMVPLLNDNRVIDVQGAKLLIAGITDPVGTQFYDDHHPDMEKARRNATKTDIKFLLAHRPGVFKEAEEKGFDLQFSGHTHAGQFFPFNLLIPLAHKFYKSLNRYNRLWIYVNPGTGYWGPANRFGVPAEITLVELIKER